MLVSVSTFYFGSTKHRTEHRVLNRTAPSTAPGTELLKMEHRAPLGTHRCAPVWCGANRNTGARSLRLYKIQPGPRISSFSV